MSNLYTEIKRLVDDANMEYLTQFLEYVKGRVPRDQEHAFRTLAKEYMSFSKRRTVTAETAQQATAVVSEDEEEDEEDEKLLPEEDDSEIDAEEAQEEPEDEDEFYVPEEEVDAYWSGGVDV